MNQTKSLIRKILKPGEGMNSPQIMSSLKSLGYEITNDTLSKNLKEMTNSYELERQAKGKPWCFYYKLKKSETGLKKTAAPPWIDLES